MIVRILTRGKFIDYKFEASDVTMLPAITTLWNPALAEDSNYDEFRELIEREDEIGVMPVSDLGNRLVIPTKLTAGVFAHDRRFFDSPDEPV
jgi:hypothetical protein